MTRAALIVGALTIGALIATPARAHEVRGEVLLLDIGERAIDLELQVPILQLEIALRTSFGHAPAVGVANQQDDLRRYAGASLGATAIDGRPFTVDVHAISVERIGDGAVIVVRARLHAPDGGDARYFILRDDLILAHVVTDTVYVFVRSDLQNGILDATPTLLGYLHYQARTLAVDRRTGSRWRSFATVFHLGLHHIASGTDHLLFLLVLLIPAPLAAAAGRWRGTRGPRASALATIRIVTAFTLGHSLTLILGAACGALLPAPFVEVTIAVSILLTAAHALRPLFPGRESVVAAGFGLIHGLAFATSLAGIGVDRPSLVIGVLGFNLGVETMQLAIVALTVPCLLVLARHRAYRALRLLVAAFAGVAAVGWILDRTGALHSPIPPLVERAASSATWLLAALAAMAVALELARHLRGRSLAT